MRDNVFDTTCTGILVGYCVSARRLSSYIANMRAVRVSLLAVVCLGLGMAPVFANVSAATATTAAAQDGASQNSPLNQVLNQKLQTPSKLDQRRIFEVVSTVSQGSKILYDRLKSLEVSSASDRLSIYVSLGELASILRIPITSSSEAVLTGWLHNKKSVWSIGQGKALSVSNISYQLKKGDIIIYRGEVFVLVSWIKKLWNLSSTYDTYNGALVFSANADTPLSRQARRTINRKSLALKAQSVDISSTYKPVRVPRYQPLALPSLSGAHLSGYTNSRGNHQAYYGAHIRGQILYSDVSAYVRGDLYKTHSSHPDKFSLSSLSARRIFDYGKNNDKIEVHLGDVKNNLSYGVVPMSTSGLGIILSSKTINDGGFYYVEGKGLVISGTSQSGSDVELYRENILLESIVAKPDGTYSFAPVKLYAGMNEFIVREYDETGLISERIVKKNSFANKMQKGEISYNFSVLDGHYKVSDFFKGSVRRRGNFDLSASTAYGLSDSTTISGSASRLARDGSIWIGANIVTDISGILLTSNIVKNLKQKGMLLSNRAALKFNIGDHPLVRAVYAGGTISFDTRANSNYSYGINALLSANFQKLNALSALSLSYKKGRNNFDNWVNLTHFTNANIKRVNVSHVYTLSGSKLDMLSTSTSSSTNIRGLWASLQVNGHDTQSSWQVKDVSLRLNSTRKNFGPAYVGMRSSYNIEDNLLNGTISLMRKTKYFNFSSALSFDTKGDYKLLFRIGSNASYVPGYGMRVSGTSMADRVIKPMFFLDADGSGNYDSNPKVEGAGLLVNNASSDEDTVSGADGVGYVFRSLRPNTTVDVSVDQRTLASSFLKSRENGYKLSNPPAPNSPFALPVPLVQIQDLRLFVYERDGDRRIPIGGMLFDLQDDEGNVMKTGRVLSHGKLYFTELVSGIYTLVPSEHQFGASNDYVPPQSIKVHLKPGKMRTRSVSVQLQRR